MHDDRLEMDGQLRFLLNFFAYCDIVTAWQADQHR